MAEKAEKTPNGVPPPHEEPKNDKKEIDRAQVAAAGIAGVVVVTTAAALWKSVHKKKKEDEGEQVALPEPEALAEPLAKDLGEKVEKRFGFFGQGKQAKESQNVTSSHRTITVEPGDTLWGLSTTYKVPIDVIKASNSILGDLILSGQELVIPGEGLLK